MIALLLFYMYAAAAIDVRYNATLIRLPPTTNGRCLDGTPGAYYYRPSSNNDTTLWMFLFEGGGWCYSLEDCKARAELPSGSSSTYLPTMSADDFSGVISSDCTKNPTFCRFNLIFIKYCDGNSFSGDRAEPIRVNPDEVLYFRGKAIREAVVAAVVPSLVMGSATTVVLAGCSSGGLTTLIAGDDISAGLTSAVPTITNVTAISISGFTVDEPNVLGDYVFPDQMKAIYNLSDAAGGMHPKCLASLPDGDAWKCNLAEYNYDVSQIRTFMVHSMMDSFQGSCILTAMAVMDDKVNGNCSAAPGYENCGMNPNSCPSNIFMPFVTYQDHFRARIATNAGFSKVGNGGFFHSCFSHCGALSNSAWHKFIVNGVAMRDAVGAWYRDAVNVSAAGHTYIGCNITVSMPHQCDAGCF